MSGESKLRVLEFFSGIGGWAAALANLRTKEDDLQTEVICAFDINDAANRAYEVICGLKPSCISLETVSFCKLESFHADVWVMSPPCQPFTRQHEVSTEDDRTNALKHITNAIENLATPPTYLALENVVGFEKSTACSQFLSALERRHYSYMQFILTPTQFGIPNERPRYFCIAKRCSTEEEWASSSSEERKKIFMHIPGFTEHSEPPQPISKYLDKDMSQSALEALYIPDTIMNKSASWCLDIVLPSDNITSCFTKAYSRYIKGTGSVLVVDSPESNIDTKGTTTADSFETSIDSPSKGGSAISSVSEAKRCKLTTSEAQEPLQQQVLHKSLQRVGETVPITAPTIGHEDHKNVDDDVAESSMESTTTGSSSFRQAPGERSFNMDWKVKLGGRRLRYFSTRELARLFGFPVQDDDTKPFFPPGISNRKGYELIGNSLNVVVATELLRFLICKDLKCC